MQHPHQEFVSHPHNMYYASMRDTSQYQNWNWESNYYEHYGQSDQHLHYLSQFNRDDREHRHYGTYPEKHFIRVQQPNIDFDRTEDWRTGDAKHPPIPKLKIRTISADEMTGFTRGSRGGSRGARARNYTNVASRPSSRGRGRRGIHNGISGVLHEGFRGRGRPRGRPRSSSSQKRTETQSISHDLSVESSKSKTDILGALENSKSDIRKENAILSSPTESIKQSTTASSDSSSSLQNKIDDVHYRIIPDITKSDFLCINLKENGIDVSRPDSLLHRKFPNMFAKSLQIVLKRLESEQTSLKPNKNVILHACNPTSSETPPTSLTSQKSSLKEPSVADSADEVNISATTVIATAAQISLDISTHKSNSNIASKEATETPPPPFPPKSNPILSEPPHKITALDISKLKSKLKNVKYPECFAAQTQTDNTLIENTNENINSANEYDSHLRSSSSEVELHPALEEKDTSTQTCSPTEQESCLSSSSPIDAPKDKNGNTETVGEEKIISDSFPLEIEKIEKGVSETNSVPLEIKAKDTATCSNDLSDMPKTPESCFETNDKSTTLAVSEIKDNNGDILDTTEECEITKQDFLCSDNCDVKNGNGDTADQIRDTGVPDNTSDLSQGFNDTDNTIEIQMSSLGNNNRDERKEKEIDNIRDIEALHTEDKCVITPQVTVDIGINKIIDAADTTPVAAGFTEVQCTTLVDNEKQRSATRHRNVKSVLASSHLPLTEVNYDSDATVRYSDDEEGNLEIDLDNGDDADARKIQDKKTDSSTAEASIDKSSTSGESHVTLPVKDDESKHNSEEDKIINDGEVKVKEIDMQLTFDKVQDVVTSSPMTDKCADNSLAVPQNAGTCKEETTGDSKTSPVNSTEKQIPSKQKRTWKKRKTAIDKNKEVEELTLFITTSPQKAPARRRRRAPVKLELPLPKETCPSKPNPVKTRRKRTNSFSQKKPTVKQRRRRIKQEFEAKDYLSQIKDTLNSKGAKQTAKDDEDDDLPTILPPKRRRRISSANRKGSESQEGGMERIYQEFPRHNWLENKYKEDGAPQEHLFEMELTSCKTETIDKPAVRKHKGKEKRRKNGLVIEKDKSKLENVTMDMEVSTTTIDDQRSEGKRDKLRSYSGTSTQQIDLHANARDMETPDSTPNPSMEENVDKNVEENEKTVKLHEGSDDSDLTKTKKSASNSEPIPLDLCIKQGKDAVPNLKTTNGGTLLATDYSESCKETATKKDLSSQKNPCVKYRTIKDDDCQIEKEVIDITDQTEKGITEEKVPIVPHRETKSAPLATDDKAVTLIRDSHSFPSFHYSATISSERKQTDLNVSTPENSVVVSLTSSNSTESIKTTTSQSNVECLDLSNYASKSQNRSAPSQASSEENVFRRPRHQEKLSEGDNDYIKHLKEFREMEKAEAKMAKEREELLRLKHEKAELLKQLGNQWQRSASNGGYNATRSTMSSQNHLNPEKYESRKLVRSHQVHSANSQLMQGKINLAQLQQQREMIKLRDLQRKIALSDNKSPPPAHTKQKENFSTLINSMEREKIQISSAIEASCPFRKRKQPVLDPHFEGRIPLISSRKIQKAHSQSPFESASSLIYPLPSFVEKKSKLCSQSSDVNNKVSGINRSSSAPSTPTDVVSQQDKLHGKTSSATVMSPINQNKNLVHNQNQENLDSPHTAKLQIENVGTPVKTQVNVNVEDLSRKPLTEAVPKETEKEIQKELNAAVARRQRTDRMINANTDGNDLSRFQSETPQRQPDRRDLGVSNTITSNVPIAPNSLAQSSTNTTQMQNHPMPILYPRQLLSHYRPQTIVSPKNVNPSVQTQLASRLKCPVTTSGIYNTAMPAQQQQQFHPQQQFPSPHHQMQSQLRKNHYVPQNPNVTSSQRILVGAKTIPNVMANGQTQYIQQTPMQGVSDRNVNMFDKRNPNNIPIRKPHYNTKAGMPYPIPNTFQTTPVRGPPSIYPMQSSSGETAHNYQQMQHAKMHRMRYTEPSQPSMETVNSKPVMQGQINTDVRNQGNFESVQNGQFSSAGRSDNSVPELAQSNVQRPLNHPPFLMHSQPTNSMQTPVMVSNEIPSQGQYIQRTVVPTSSVALNSQTTSGTAKKHMTTPVANIVPGAIAIAPSNVITGSVNGTVGSTQVVPVQTPMPMGSPVIPMQSSVAPPQLQHVNGNCIVCGNFAMFLCSSCQKIWYCSQKCQLNHWVTHAQDCKTFTSEGSAGMT